MFICVFVYLSVYLCVCICDSVFVCVYEDGCVRQRGAIFPACAITLSAIYGRTDQDLITCAAAELPAKHDHHNEQQFGIMMIIIVVCGDDHHQTIIVIITTKGRCQKKKRFFLGLCPKLWVGGGQKS